jgi:hypothetical protein
MRIVAVPEEKAEALTLRTLCAGMPNVQVPVEVVDATAFPVFGRP